VANTASYPKRWIDPKAETGIPPLRDLQDSASRAIEPDRHSRTRHPACLLFTSATAPNYCFPSLTRIEPFAAEPPHEFFGVSALGKTIDIEPLAFVKDGVPPRAKGKLFAELMDGRVTTLQT
jgi:hypothetical protein